MIAVNLMIDRTSVTTCLGMIFLLDLPDTLLSPYELMALQAHQANATLTQDETQAPLVALMQNTVEKLDKFASSYQELKQQMITRDEIQQEMEYYVNK